MTKKVESVKCCHYLPRSWLRKMQYSSFPRDCHEYIQVLCSVVRILRSKKSCQPVEGENLPVFHIPKFQLNSKSCSILKYLCNKPSAAQMHLTFFQPQNCRMNWHRLLSQANWQTRKWLLTFIPWAETTRISAGIRSPPLTSTKSPMTTFSARIWHFLPSRMTRHCYTINNNYCIVRRQSEDLKELPEAPCFWTIP